MGKVLVIRKPDRSIHQSAIGNAPAMKAYSNRLPAALQWKFEEMDQEQADKLPAIDPHYVTAAQASSKVDALQKQNEAMNAENEELRNKLAELLKGSQFQQAPSFEDAKQMVNKSAQGANENNIVTQENNVIVPDPTSNPGNGLPIALPIAQPIADPSATGNAKKKSGPKAGAKKADKIN